MHSKISELVGKISRLTNLPSFPQVSKLELDLLKQQVRDLYDELNSLNAVEQVQKAAGEINDFIKGEDVNAEQLTQEEEIVLPKVKPVVKETVVVKEEPMIAESRSEVKTRTAAKISINEIMQTPESLNSKLKQPTKELQHKFPGKPMKELIDLNKRFVMINELFGGSAETFSKAIQQIDALNDFAEAESFIHSGPAIQHQWADSSPTVKLFWELVKQKFGVVHL